MGFYFPFALFSSTPVPKVYILNWKDDKFIAALVKCITWVVNITGLNKIRLQPNNSNLFFQMLQNFKAPAPHAHNQRAIIRYKQVIHMTQALYNL